MILVIILLAILVVYFIILLCDTKSSGCPKCGGDTDIVCVSEHGHTYECTSCGHRLNIGY